MPGSIPAWISKRLDPVELLLRSVVGVVFLDSAWSKLADPLNFSDDVRNYRLLEDPWIAWLAMALPPFLFLVGVCLIARLLYPGVLVAAAGALLVFTGALISLLARGIDVECGCLSFSFPISIQLLIDALLIGICAVLFWMWRSSHKPDAPKNHPEP